MNNLFRIWHKPTKRFTTTFIEKVGKGEKLCGYEQYIDGYQSYKATTKELFISPDGRILYMEYSPYDNSSFLHHSHDEEYELQMYTGYNDSKDKPIYEGDLIKVSFVYNRILGRFVYTTRENGIAQKTVVNFGLGDNVAYNDLDRIEIVEHKYE